MPCIGPLLPRIFRSISRSDACLSRLTRGAMEIKALAAMPATLCRSIWARYFSTRWTPVRRPESSKVCRVTMCVVRTSKLSSPANVFGDAMLGMKQSQIMLARAHQCIKACWLYMDERKKTNVLAAAHHELWKLRVDQRRNISLSLYCLSQTETPYWMPRRQRSGTRNLTRALELMLLNQASPTHCWPPVVCWV